VDLTPEGQGAVMDSLVMDTVVGLVFVFSVFAVFVSAVQEAVARWIGLRGEYLLRGLRTLVSGGGDFRLDPRDLVGVSRPVDGSPDVVGSYVTQLMNSSLIAPMAKYGVMPALAGNAPLTNRQRRGLPAYVPARTAARAIISIAVPDAANRTTMTQISEVLATLPGDANTNPLKGALVALASEAEGDVTQFRRSVEDWYDDHMDRVSGWYKRHARWITLAVAALTVVVFNLNVVAITQSLYGDETLRAAVVTAATEASDCGTKEPAQCLDDLRDEIDGAGQAGLPIGWRDVEACSEPATCSFAERKGLLSVDGGSTTDATHLLTILLGWALMTAAALPGARFWFDALSKLGTLRSTGPKPTTSR
jgi:hypothetical protein